MLTFDSILCSVPRRPALAVAAALLLGACGQRGPLYLPTEPAAAGRASLPQSLNPTRAASDPAAPPAPAAMPPQDLPPAAGNTSTVRP
ncbi:MULTISPECIES: LPS translocon maturation chaperone LptM [Ramlibacter]|jgi:predicted small lipoprotein YifL|uniref:Sugar transporter n=1 Tax=Ramlibacter pinisoli TaxID=2682844 RepID=A0A6N8J0G7_9BURK|nr:MULTISPECIES: lipoprotein [Ramlibacter]MBA2962586.1 lipoprotein [Ramlibacter sp. CGMCC 1.13660]MVQ32528.1 hypothetical protein [Ramlibacter pinisoli]